MFRQVGVESTGEAKKGGGGGEEMLYITSKSQERIRDLYMYAYSQRSIQV